MSDIVLGILIAVVVGLVVYLVWQARQPPATSTTVVEPGLWNWRGWPWWWFGDGPTGGHWRPSGGGRPHPRPRPEPHPFGPGGEHHTYPLGPGGQHHMLGPGGLGPSGRLGPGGMGPSGGHGSFAGGGTRLR
jgi:hypothetical protein